MADLPDPCAQPLSCYILVTSFCNPCRHNNNNAAESEEANPSGIEEVNSLATSVCESMFIAIYTTQKNTAQYAGNWSRIRLYKT